MEEYALREKKKKSKLPMILLALLYLLTVAFITYNYISYKLINGISADSFDALIDSFNILLQKGSCVAELSFDTMKEIFRLNFITNAIWIHIVFVGCVMLLVVKEPASAYKGVEKGSAKWATESEKAKFRDSEGIPIAHNFYVSLDEKKVKGVVQAKLPNLNQLIVGGSGSGKSYRAIKPQIMSMTGNYVVTDPKGELYRDCCKMLKKNNYNVKVLNFYDLTFSNKYNPFAYVKNEQDVLKIAEMYMKASGGKDDKSDYWSNSAKDMFAAVLNYLYVTPTETKTFGRALWLISSIRYYNGFISPKCEYSEVMKSHALNPRTKNDMTSLNWNSVQGTAEQTLSGTVSTLITRLELWSTKAVNELTCKDEMNFDDFANKNKRTAIFVITPPADTTYAALVTLFYAQLFDRLQYVANIECNGRLPHMVNILMDEFANCNGIKDFDKELSVLRSYSMRAVIVLQGISQLKNIYKDAYQNIITNCCIFTYLGTPDTDTNKFVEERLGKATIKTESRSYNRQGSGGGSDTHGKDSRSLLTVNEIEYFAFNKKGEGNKYDGRCVVFIPGFNPFKLYKFDTSKHPQAMFVGSSFEKDFKNNTDIRKMFVNTDETSAYVSNQKVDTRVHSEPELPEQESAREYFEAIDNGVEVESMEITAIEETDLINIESAELNLS